MSAHRTNRTRRRMGYSRHVRGKKAVSPVVATLILILIAVAAAAALYLWLVAWQGGVTKGIGSPSAQYTVSLGGSTSVYPFAELAATQFEQNNSDVVISVNQGGSGAGMAAVCSGQVDIGDASQVEVDSSLVSGDGCPSTVVQETVAYDGVDAIISSTNTHGLSTISWDTLQTIYVGADTEAGAHATNLCSFGLASAPTQSAAGAIADCTYNDGGSAAATTPAYAQTSTVNPGLAWDQIPACVAGVADCAGTTTTEVAVTAGFTAYNVADADLSVSGDVLVNSGGTAGTATPCGWSVCAGGSTAAITGTVISGNALNEIQPWARSDVSGTETAFGARLLAVGASGSNPGGLSFSGCSGDNQLDGCTIALPSSQLGDGNPGVIAGVHGSADAIGFASDGLVQAAGSGVTPLNFQGYGQTGAVNIQGETSAIKAIANGIADGTNTASWTASGTAAYVGWRPFVMVETAPPTGEVLRFLEFIMDPANNINCAAEAAEISVYASGLAGVVPVTPIP